MRRSDGPPPRRADDLGGARVNRIVDLVRVLSWLALALVGGVALIIHRLI
jgi:hypothetical protein